MIGEIVEAYLQKGSVDEEILEQAIRVGVRKRKKAKTDPEKRKKAREYYRKNRAKILKKAKEYRRKNKKKIQAYAKAYKKKFGESVEDTKEQLIEKLKELLKIAEEIDALLFVIIDQMIEEIKVGDLNEEDIKEYKEIVNEISQALIADRDEEEEDDDE